MGESDHLQLMGLVMEMRVDIGKISTRLEKLDDFNRSLEEFKGQVKELARRCQELERCVAEAGESTKSAHKRLNSFGRVAYWLLTAIGGAVIVTIVGFALKGGFYIK